MPCLAERLQGGELPRALQRERVLAIPQVDLGADLERTKQNLAQAVTTRFDPGALLAREEWPSGDVLRHGARPVRLSWTARTERRLCFVDRIRRHLDVDPRVRGKAQLVGTARARHRDDAGKPGP